MHNNQKLLDFSGKTVLITGAASGIGKATAILLSNLGAKLLLLDINEKQLIETLELCSSSSSYVVADLADTQSLKKIIEGKIVEMGALDALVHVAGIPYLSPLKTINMDTVDKVMKINTFSALELSKIFSKFKNHKEDNPSILYISSVYGLVGSAANVAYAMSKASLHGVTKSLAIELAPKKIRVNCIAPGFIKTEMLDQVSDSFDDDYNQKLSGLHPLGLGNANDIANAICFLISDMSRWTTGSIMSVDGGFTAQ